MGLVRNRNQYTGSIEHGKIQIDIPVDPGEYTQDDPHKSWWINLVDYLESIQTAEQTPFTPDGDIEATNVQDAIIELDIEKAALAGAVFTGQVTPGKLTETFSASKTINFIYGNVQKMAVTGDTTIAIDNELAGGTYLLFLEIDTGTPPVITLDASFGTAIDNSATLLTADNDVNIINIIVDPDGVVYYGVNTVTA